MAGPLRLVMLEDAEADAELNVRALRRAGLAVEWRRVETREALLAALDEFPPDLILCDHGVPGFGGLPALQLLHERVPDVPTITVTGSLDEETAVECIKAGAWDYVLKERLVRLPPAVNRALEQAREARARKQAEAEVGRSEARFRLLVESIPDALLVSDREGRVLLVNEQSEKLFGYTREDLIGRGIETLVPEALRDRHVGYRAGYAAAPRVRLMAPELNLRARRKDGSEVPVEITLSPVETVDGPAVISIVRDISERIELEERVRQLQRLDAIGQLAGGIAHDFNNLLTVIAGHAQLLLARVPLDDRLRRDLEVISKTADRAAALTKQILAFSRRQPLEPRVLDLNAVVSGMVELLKRLLGEHIGLTFRPGAELGRVRVDPGQLEQVVINLAVNARDAMPAGGRLTVETVNVELDDEYARRHTGTTPGPYVMLAVSDTGIGMDAATRARIFEPFFTTKAPGKGTGLGLATVYGVVKQHHGNVWVYSEPGEGSVFKVYLPRVADVADALETPSPRSGRGTETILLVEDDDGVRGLAREIFTDYGYTVLEAREPAEARLIAERHTGPIDLLATDVVMPGMSGRALADGLASLRPEMKVLYMSGYTDNAIVHHGRLDPGTKFIQKPFTAAALAGKVREVLESPE